MVKFSFLAAHLFFGVGGNLFAIASLHFLLLGKQVKMVRFSFFEFLCSLLTVVSGACYYIFYYQPDKIKIITGKFPAAHNVFMEVKEHAFIMFFLISIYLQFRIFFTVNLESPNFKAESKMVLISIILLGLLMSVTGFMVNTGFRINQ